MGTGSRGPRQRRRSGTAAATASAVAVGKRMTVEDVSASYVAAAERRGRKLSTRSNIESVTRVHLEPTFRGKTLDAIRREDVLDLVAALEARRLAPKSIGTSSRL